MCIRDRIPAFLRRPALPEEGGLPGREAAPAVEFVRPGAGGVQPRPPVERRRIAALALPLDGRVGQLLVDQEPRPVGADPAAQPRPGVQQGLVGDLHGVAVHGDQAGPYEGVERGRGRARVGQLLHEGRPAHPPPRRTRTVGDVHQPHQDAAERVLLGGVEAAEHLLGGPGDGPLDAAGALVSGDGQGGALAPAPGGHQRVGDQRQRAGGRRPAGRPVAQADVAQQQGDQPGFEGETREPGRAGDGFLQLRGRHRRQDEQPAGEDGGQLREVQAVAGEVGPYAEHHDGRVVRDALRARDRQRAEHPYERAPLVLVGAEGEQLLELVDQQHRTQRRRTRARPGRRGRVRQPVDRFEQGVGPLPQLLCRDARIAAQHLRGAAEQFVQRLRGRGEPDHRPGVGARHREAAAAQGRYEAGVQQGGLAGARRGDEHQGPGADPFEDPFGQLGGGPLPAEEPAGVPLGEGGQAAVGAFALRPRPGHGDGALAGTLRGLGLPGHPQQFAPRPQYVVATPRDVDGHPLRAGLDLAEIALAVVRLAREVRERQAALQPQTSQLGREGPRGVVGLPRSVGLAPAVRIPQSIPHGSVPRQ